MRIMAKATWEGAVLAESTQTVEVEGNQYFPSDAICEEYFQPSKEHSVCPGRARRAITTLKSTASAILERLGTTLIRSLQRSRSKIMSHSGRV